MTSRKKLLIFTGLLFLLFQGFTAVDKYFEISKNMEIFSTVYKSVQNDYVDEVNPGELMKTGIDAMLASLDPYTVYYTESQAEDAMIMQSGEYGGVGCQSMKMGDYIVITNIFKGKPADRAGMRVGDKIVEINGKNFKGKTDNEVSEVMKGSPNSTVVVKVDRQGQLMDIKITREEVKISSVTYTGMIDESTGYIRLDHFLMGAGHEVKTALLSLKEQGMKKLILDLRDNGGGLLHEAVNIVNVFIDYNELVVISKGKSTDSYREYKTMDRVTDPLIPLTVLVNDHSASASEIVCGAIQDFDRGVVIGRNTFGKGLVQNVRPLIYRSQMKVTIAKYYIPSGRCIQLLDYAHKDENGKPMIVPDSLRKKFKTANGRTVYDGGGVRPDIMVEKKEDPVIISALTRNNIVFNFASQYRHNNDINPDIRTFVVSDAIYNQFREFCKTAEFSNPGASESALENLKKKLKSDQYAEGLETQIKSLEIGLRQMMLKDIDIYKKEISELLAIEICRRYHYDDALYIRSFDHDQDLKKCRQILADQAEMDKILGK